MIYKFKDFDNPVFMEIELLSEDNGYHNEYETVNLNIALEGDDNYNSIDLTKSQVYKLIGALHLLHKEMK